MGNELEPPTCAQISELDTITMLFFAYRAHIEGADRILAKQGFGRAHHRALFFICRKPGLTVAQLLNILGITKQSLARVLRQLVDKGYVEQHSGQSDRRQRLLYLTKSGSALVVSLSQSQLDRIQQACKKAGMRNSEKFVQTLFHMMSEEDQHLLEILKAEKNDPFTA